MFVTTAHYSIQLLNHGPAPRLARGHSFLGCDIRGENVAASHPIRAESDSNLICSGAKAKPGREPK